MDQLTHHALKDLAPDEQLYQTLIDNNVNLVSGLATNYLNHYIEILLLLEMLPDMPDCFEDIRLWQPMNYRDHVMNSRLPNNDIVLKAYDAADEMRRKHLADIAGEANQNLQCLIARAGTALDLNDACLLRSVCAEAKEFLTPTIERMTGVITPDAATTRPFIEFNHQSLS